MNKRWSGIQFGAAARGGSAAVGARGQHQSVWRNNGASAAANLSPRGSFGRLLAGPRIEWLGRVERERFLLIMGARSRFGPPSASFGPPWAALLAPKQINWPPVQAAQGEFKNCAISGAERQNARRLARGASGANFATRSAPTRARHSSRRKSASRR